MISVAEALAHVTSSLRPLAAEQVALSDALGRVLAEDVASRLTQPPVDVSAMDGTVYRLWISKPDAPQHLREYFLLAKNMWQ